MFTFGFDIGASRLKAALVEDKKIIKTQQVNLPNSLADLLDLMEKTLKEMTGGYILLTGLGVT